MHRRDLGGGRHLSRWRQRRFTAAFSVPKLMTSLCCGCGGRRHLVGSTVVALAIGLSIQAARRGCSSSGRRARPMRGESHSIA
ncbi:MAG TPA: hypothetical protein VGJ16_14505, partial [Pirellulales bacterium]